MNKVKIYKIVPLKFWKEFKLANKNLNNYKTLNIKMLQKKKYILIFSR
jgi:hypothetical protein